MLLWLLVSMLVLVSSWELVNMYDRAHKLLPDMDLLQNVRVVVLPLRFATTQGWYSCAGHKGWQIGLGPVDCTGCVSIGLVAEAPPCFVLGSQDSLASSRLAVQPAS